MDKPTDRRSGTRRIFSNEFKLHMVELASRPNANVAHLTILTFDGIVFPFVKNQTAIALIEIVGKDDIPATGEVQVFFLAFCFCFFYLTGLVVQGIFVTF